MPKLVLFPVAASILALPSEGPTIGQPPHPGLPGVPCSCSKISRLTESKNG